MPELPEVERARRRVERQAVGRRVERAIVSEDPIVFEDVSPARIRRALVGRTVVAARRWGKHFWMELDRAPHLLMHLGMTGSIELPGCERMELASGPRAGVAEGWPPRFTKLRLRFDDGGEFAFTNARRLGRVRLRDRPREEPPLSELGFDPLLAMPGPREFDALLARRKGVLKGVLLDQGFAAGVGNWIADEVLYQARLDPRRRADQLDAAQRRRLRNALARVIRRAAEVDAEKSRFPRTWLFHHRWGRDEEARTAAGHRVEFLTIAGRSTAWVPERQT